MLRSSQRNSCLVLKPTTDLFLLNAWFICSSWALEQTLVSFSRVARAQSISAESWNPPTHVVSVQCFILLFGGTCLPCWQGLPLMAGFWSLPTGSANHNHPHRGSQSEPFPGILTGADQAPSLPTSRLQGFPLELPPSRDSSRRV